jgi:hypothetical protein
MNALTSWWICSDAEFSARESGSRSDHQRSMVGSAGASGTTRGRHCIRGVRINRNAGFAAWGRPRQVGRHCQSMTKVVSECGIKVRVQR